MLDLILIIIFLIGLFVGVKRGFILQLIHMVGFILAFFVAYKYYDTLAPKLELWIPYPDIGSDGNGILQMIFGNEDLEMAFYRAVAFVAIFIATRIVLAIIGSALDIVASLPIIKTVNIILGGVLGFVETYLIVFILLYIVALVPLEFIQNPLNESSIVEWMLTNTPYFSEKIQELWFKVAQ